MAVPRGCLAGGADFVDINHHDRQQRSGLSSLSVICVGVNRAARKQRAQRDIDVNYFSNFKSIVSPLSLLSVYIFSLRGPSSKYPAVAHAKARSPRDRFILAVEMRVGDKIVLRRRFTREDVETFTIVSGDR